MSFITFVLMITGAERLAEEVLCYHCGDTCRDEHISIEEKHFCCEGCKSVYQILNENNLCGYYDYTEHPGTKQKQTYSGKFSYLDDAAVASKLLLFSNEEISVVKFHLPLIHCASCIWLLEHLNKIDSAILKSEVNFLKKEVIIHYDHNGTTLSGIASRLTMVGYEPWISLEDEGGAQTKKFNKSRIYKIGVAGFCFGNIMLLSFPEYFAGNADADESLLKTFSALNLILSLPVLLYSAGGFFISAYKGLRSKFLNIDAPIALAIIVTFLQSVYEIFSGTGPGYLDSMSGIVFFMLLGRYLQDKTHDSVSFERNFRSYFPMGITIVDAGGNETQQPVSQLREGSRIKVYDEEIVPADAVLLTGDATIDYSFVTGESKTVEVKPGKIIYAGGRQKGGALQLQVIKEVSDSYLTSLWNNSAFTKEKEYESESFVHKVSTRFAFLLFIIAFTAFIAWQFIDPSKALTALTSVLIIACPCTLLLASTFTFGYMQNILQKAGVFLKNPVVIEKIASTDHIVFDKTGTLTEPGNYDIQYVGQELTEEERNMAGKLAAQSSHPLSRAIHQFLPVKSKLRLKNFREEKGKGTLAEYEGNIIRLGAAEFCGVADTSQDNTASVVYLSVNGNVMGKFVIKTAYRKDLKQLFERVNSQYTVAVVSGDNNSSEKELGEICSEKVELVFNARPADKLEFVKRLQEKNKKVLMIGDGLNDAGALMQSDTGIVVTDNMNNFTPASDAIMPGAFIGKMNELIQFCKNGKTIIYASFGVSILYNIVGIYFAVRAELKPVIAAVLMPASSLSIILITLLLSYLLSSAIRKNN